MKKLLLFLFMMLLMVHLVADDSFDISMNGIAYYSSFKINYVDPGAPLNQPTLFMMTFKTPEQDDSDTASELDYQIELSFSWNGADIFKTILVPLGLAREFGSTIHITNRDLITSLGSPYFEFAPGEGISLNSIIENNSQLNDLILETGSFPDGRYTFNAKVKGQNSAYTASEKSYSFSVTNTTSLYLIRPGTRAGSAEIRNLADPLVFNWSCNSANPEYVIEIKEFDEKSDLTVDNIENNGRVFFEDTIHYANSFQQSLPYNEGKYYSWRVGVKLFDDNFLNNNNITKYKYSQYYVFRYSTSQENTVFNPFHDDLIKALYELDYDDVTALLESGYEPVDGIEIDGKFYFGKEAIQLIKQLLEVNSIDVSVE